MDIKLDITPEKIEQEITRAIIKSSIGKHIEQSVAKAIGGYSFDNQVADAVKNTVAEMIRSELIANAELKEKIKGEVANKLTDTHINQIYEKLMDQITY